MPGTLSVTDQGSPEIRFRIAGHDTYQGSLDVGLPGINFEVSGGLVDISFHYDMLLGFGLSKTEGFYFIIQRDQAVPNSPQFYFTIGTELNKTSQMTGELLNLPIIASALVDAMAIALPRLFPRLCKPDA